MAEAGHQPPARIKENMPHPGIKFGEKAEGAI